MRPSFIRSDLRLRHVVTATFLASMALAGSMLGGRAVSAQTVQTAQQLPPVTIEPAQRSEDIRPVQTEQPARPRPRPEQEAQPQAEPKVVEATSPTLIATPLPQVPNSITVITGADLQRDQIRTVPDALRAVPGLNIVQTGGPGGQTSIFTRGTNSNHTKMIIDGIDDHFGGGGR